MKKNINKKLKKQLDFHSQRIKSFFIKKDRGVWKLTTDSTVEDDLIESITEECLELLSVNFLNANKTFTHIWSKGIKSHNGPIIDAMEGVSRLLPLMAVLGNTTSINDKNKKIINSAIKSAIINGTSKTLFGWGLPKADVIDQRVVEVADIALAIWISKENVWSNLNSDEKLQIFLWLEKYQEAKVPENNWKLFTLIINVVLHNLSSDIENKKIDVKFAIIDDVKGWYAGGGWFKDGNNGAIDYYSAWAFSYSFFWLAQINEQFTFLNDYIIELNENYIYLFSSSGVPLFGRSVCYKHAVLVPLISEIEWASEERLERTGKAIRVILETFGPISTIATQGFKCQNESLVDVYSGPNSCFWGLRPFIQLLYLENKQKLVNLEQSKKSEIAFPIEVSDFEISPNKHIQIHGQKSGLLVTVINEDAFEKNDFDKSSRIIKIIKYLIGFPERDKHHPYYNLRAFNSKNEVLRK